MPTTRLSGNTSARRICGAGGRREVRPWGRAEERRTSHSGGTWAWQARRQPPETAANVSEDDGRVAFSVLCTRDDPRSLSWQRGGIVAGPEAPSSAQHYT